MSNALYSGSTDDALEKARSLPSARVENAYAKESRQRVLQGVPARGRDCDICSLSKDYYVVLAAV